jgi:hypothetical protein
LPFSRNQICLLDEGLLNLFHTQWRSVDWQVVLFCWDLVLSSSFPALGLLVPITNVTKQPFHNFRGLPKLISPLAGILMSFKCKLQLIL